MKLTAVFVKGEIGYSSFIAELPGANTQGDTLEEARHNLQEAASMILEANKDSFEDFLAKEVPPGHEIIRQRFEIMTQDLVLNVV